MLLPVAAAIVALGLAVWVIGKTFSYTGIAIIGAVLVLGAGSAATVGGIQYADGQTVETTTSETTVAIDDIGDATHTITKDVSAQDSSPTGVDFNEEGSMMYISGASTASIYSYDSGIHDLSIATVQSSFDVSGQDTTPVGVEFRPDGSEMFVTGDDNDAIYQYALSTPYDITTASPNGNFSVGAHVTSPRAADFNPDGTTFYVVGAGGTIHQYSLTTAFDVTTAAHTNDFDVSSQESTPTALDFSADGTRMLLVGEDQDTIFQYVLETPYDVATAAYTGNRLDISPQANRAAGLAYEADGQKIFLADRQGSTLEQYDSRVTQTDSVTTKATTYEDVNTPQRFSLGALLLLLSATMMAQTLQERAT